ncbi:MAG: hypothetical protein P1V19_05830 [Gimesia sp.]|nr:hypothetical protein [Gimesia sp.]
MNGHSHFAILAVVTSLTCNSPEASAEVFDKELAVDERVVISNEDLPKGWVVASDPELVKFGNRWWMFFNSIQLDFEKGLPIHVLAANLPPDVPLSAAPGKWTVLPNPVISPGPKGSWDDRTIETTKYVFGYDATLKKYVGRLYYVGWPVQKNGQKHYQIGFAEWNDERRQWVKHSDPIVTGTEKWEKINDSSFIGDQSVYYEAGPGRGGADGVWHMWYQAVSNPRAGGVAIVHLTSKDGISWGNKKRLTHKVPFTNQFVKTGPFSLDVLVKNGRYYFAGFLYNQQDLRKQGLWITESSTPDGSAAGDFTNWYPLIFENNGVKWHDSGLVSSKCHATGLFAPTLREENGQVWMFYHGYHRTGEVKDPCKDKSKNSGVIGRALVKDFAKIGK